MPQMDISQLVNRDTPGTQPRNDGPAAPAQDFMAMVQERVRAGEMERERGRDATPLRDAAADDRNAVQADARTTREPERPAVDESGSMVKKFQEERQSRDDRGAGNAVEGDTRPEKAKAKRDKKTDRGEQADDTTALKDTADHLRATVRAAAQSVRSLGDAAPEMKNLEKSLQAFQELAIHGGSSKRMELFAELRLRVKDALQHLERREEAARGADAVKIAGTKNRIKTLEGMMEEQVRGGRNGRQQAQAGPVLKETATQPQADMQPLFQRETRQAAERISDSEGRDAGIGINAGRNVQSQMKSAAQAAAQRMPLANEQFESIMNNARVVVRDGKNGSFIMNLYPESLGRVNVNLGLEDGVIVGRFLVDSGEARDMMVENLDQLRTVMEEAGIQVGSFQVNVRGERERLVRELQESLAGRGRRAPVEAQRDYEIQSYRAHDGALDVIA